ncbi:MAG: tRNA lysidine(34) synthetase TilS [Bacteroidales bacterium]|nr:tRNA lysidine(34) synthetase TilS [Bacteroidales bacterium]
MLDRFNNFLTQTFHLRASANILVTVSGGLDSVVLLNLLSQSGFRLAIAHANFQLRGDESERDEMFVSKLADEYNVPFYVARFDTLNEAQSRGISIQMAARDLRYNWFDELANTQGYDCIAVAHHLDDQIETFFINILRGTGLSGLRGMPVAKGKIIRPLLFAFRDEIMDYARAYKLMFVEDSSNRETDYLRNQLRHKIIPLFEEIQPSFRRMMASNLQNLASAEVFLKQHMRRTLDEIVENRGEELWISIRKLHESGHEHIVLHDLLGEFGFRAPVTEKIAQAIDSQPGKVFYSHSHQLLKDRDWMIVSPIRPHSDDDSEFIIYEETTEIYSPLRIEMQVYPTSQPYMTDPDPDMAFLDFDTIAFPLTLRRWKTGDRFKPLGMDGSMKLSDYFVSRSYNLNQKKEAWILADATGRIVWLIGQRISNDSRITSSTKIIYRIHRLQ